MAQMAIVFVGAGIFIAFINLLTSENKGAAGSSLLLTGGGIGSVVLGGVAGSIELMLGGFAAIAIGTIVSFLFKGN